MSTPNISLSSIDLFLKKSLQHPQTFIFSTQGKDFEVVAKTKLAVFKFANDYAYVECVGDSYALQLNEELFVNKLSLFVAQQFLPLIYSCRIRLQTTFLKNDLPKEIQLSLIAKNSIEVCIKGITAKSNITVEEDCIQLITKFNRFIDPVVQMKYNQSQEEAINKMKEIKKKQEALHYKPPVLVKMMTIDECKPMLPEVKKFNRKQVIGDRIIKKREKEAKEAQVVHRLKFDEETDQKPKKKAEPIVFKPLELNVAEEEEITYYKNTDFYYRGKNVVMDCPFCKLRIVCGKIEDYESNGDEGKVYVCNKCKAHSCQKRKDNGCSNFVVAKDDVCDYCE